MRPGASPSAFKTTNTQPLSSCESSTPSSRTQFAEEQELIRVIDESGEDYLFPDSYFMRVSLPQEVESRLQNIA